MFFKKPTLHYMRQITIKSLRDYILDNELTEKDSLLLNRKNFDDIILEFRATYRESITVPYFLLRVLIQEDNLGKVPSNRVGVIKDDNNRFENDYAFKVVSQPKDNFKYETIYRCGWCGNVVDYDGSEFNSSTRQFKIDILEKNKNTVTVKHVNGKCCPNGHDK
jgi:hypothetical protein